MIRYSLQCRKAHVFDAWFRDSAAFDSQAAEGAVRCPVCGSKKVEKTLMAPNLGKSDKGSDKAAKRAQVDMTSADITSTALTSAGLASADWAKAKAAKEALQALRRQVEENCDYVGTAFPEEARKIHYGEADARGIYGESSTEEAKALEEEGVQVQRIPGCPGRTLKRSSSWRFLIRS